MESGVIKISQRELQRDAILKMVVEERMTLLDAAQKIGVSYRQAKRLKKAYKEQGINGIIHSSRGKEASNKVDDELRLKILSLSQEKYSAFNDTYFTELLGEREDIVISRESVRKIRREAGIRAKRKRRAPKHLSRRQRKAQEGMMMLWDGSPHHWFGKDYPACCLMASMDDATGRVLSMFFVEQESAWAYLELLRRVIKKHGIPLSVYQDKHGALKRNDDKWSIEEQLDGRQRPTQVGCALEALGIEAIFALSPQAKGRVERLFQTLQDRLVSMMALDGIKGIAAGNAYIENSFLSTFNRKFAKPAKETEVAWRKLERGQDLKRILSFRYDGKVGNDNAVRLSGIVIDIPPGPGKRSYAGAIVEIRQLLDASWRVYYQNTIIATAEAIQSPESMRPKNKRASRFTCDTAILHLDHHKPVEGADIINDEAIAKTAIGQVRRASPGRTIGASRLA